VLKRHPHTPPHLLLDATPYFLTGAIHEKRRLLSAELKWRLIELLQEKFVSFGWELHHWVVLDNYYHAMGLSKDGKDLPDLIKQLHASSAGDIRAATDCCLPVWWNYWDYCPRNDRDYAIRLNYLLNNPIKHGYTDNLHDYPFSSFGGLYEEKGRTRLADQFRQFGEYKTLRIEEDDF